MLKKLIEILVIKIAIKIKNRIIQFKGFIWGIKNISINYFNLTN